MRPGVPAHSCSSSPALMMMGSTLQRRYHGSGLHIRVQPVCSGEMTLRKHLRSTDRSHAGQPCSAATAAAAAAVAAAAAAAVADATCTWRHGFQIQDDEKGACDGAHPSFLKASSVMNVLPQPFGPHTPSITGTRTPPSESARKFFTMCICGTARGSRSRAELRLGAGTLCRWLRPQVLSGCYC